MAVASLAIPRRPSEEAQRAVERFVAGARSPRILELGEPAFRVTPESLKLELRGRWMVVEAMDEDRFLSRRVVRIRNRTADRIELVTEKFGGQEGSLVVFDAERPSTIGLRQKGQRHVAGSQFRTFLEREFRGWRVAGLSTDANLEDSLSPSYPRALLRQGRSGIAAILAPWQSDVDGILTFGLIWLDYLRRREPELAIEALALFVPAGVERNTCLRLRWLDPSGARFLLYTYTRDGHAAACDMQDWGNLETRIEAAARVKPAALEPESMLEDQVRSQLPVLDARLRPAPVYGQAPAFAGVDRGIMDLLAMTWDGRLMVIELKATESIHLPLQALDYWLRVEWHLRQGDLARNGYFAGHHIHPAPPRLALVAPALRFHSTHERILRFLHPDIEIQSIGVASGWGGPLKVLFRDIRQQG